MPENCALMPSAQTRTHASVISIAMFTFTSGGKRPIRSQSFFRNKQHTTNNHINS
jgi:hypothetical protein